VTSGLYAITNTATGERYIGSAIDLARRWRRHRHDLRVGIHRNKNLQAAWNMHGENRFQFMLIEECAPEMLLDREQELLDNEKPEYNISFRAGAPMFGRKHSSETRAKQSAAARNRSPEQRANIAAARRGKRHSPDARAKMSACNIGRAPWNKGKKMGPPWNKGKLATIDARLHMSISQRARQARDHGLS